MEDVRNRGCVVENQQICSRDPRQRTERILSALSGTLFNAYDMESSASISILAEIPWWTVRCYTILLGLLENPSLPTQRRGEFYSKNRGEYQSTCQLGTTTRNQFNPSIQISS